MVHIVLLDHDPASLSQSSELVHEYFSARDLPCRISPFTSQEPFCRTFDQEPGGMDIILLDVTMPDKNGANLAKWIYERDRRCVLAFLSESSDNAAHGYGVNAVAYALKPLDRQNTARVLDACLDRLAENPPRKPEEDTLLAIKSGRATRFVEAESIFFLESNQRRVDLHCVNGIISSREKLTEIMSRLPGQGLTGDFVQVHRSYIVNLRHMNAFRGGFLIAENGDPIPISRAFRDQAETRWFKHVTGNTHKD